MRLRISCCFAQLLPPEKVALSWRFLPGPLLGAALDCATLEVYYRYLPIYRQHNAAEEFPLELGGEPNPKREA